MVATRPLEEVDNSHQCLMPESIKRCYHFLNSIIIISKSLYLKTYIAASEGAIAAFWKREFKALVCMKKIFTGS